jgi:hypothetical protein
MDFEFRFPAMSRQTHTYNNQLTPHTPTHTNTQQSTKLWLSFWNLKVGPLFEKWMNLHKLKIFKFALGEDPFDVFDVLAEQEAK